MNQPIVEFRSQSAPYSVIASVSYSQSTLGGNFLPVKEGEDSNIVAFRIYNNFNTSGSIAAMTNVRITAYDGVGQESHTAMQSVTSQSWVRIYETGFGESTIIPGAYSYLVGTDTAIGKSGSDYYAPDYGSDGTTNPYIRAGVDGNGVGFVEFATYSQVPSGAGFASYTLALSVDYHWSP